MISKLTLYCNAKLFSLVFLFFYCYTLLNHLLLPLPKRLSHYYPPDHIFTLNYYMSTSRLCLLFLSNLNIPPWWTDLLA